MFNESAYIRLLFLLSDTHGWLQTMEQQLLEQLPLEGSKKKLFKQNYLLTVPAMAHIVERHYYKIQRHPDAGKFTITLPDILYWIKQAATQAMQQVPDSPNLYRWLDTQIIIGFDKQGINTSIITVITSPCGYIKTAFPGQLNS